MTLRHDSWQHSEAPTVHFSLSLVWAPRLQTLCIASYLEVLWSVWCYTKTQTEIWGKRKTKAYENTEAAVSDTNGYKSWDFSTSKWVYFCFPQLNLEIKWNLISDKNFSRWQKAQSYLAFCPIGNCSWCGIFEILWLFLFPVQLIQQWNLYPDFCPYEPLDRLQISPIHLSLDRIRGWDNGWITLSSWSVSALQESMFIFLIIFII